MVNYLICHVDGGYLYKASDDRWSRTSDKNKAVRLTYEKAHNILTNCIAANVRSSWKIIEEESGVSMPEKYVSTEEIKGFDWDEISQTWYTIYNELVLYGEQLNRHLSEVDLEICDIQHYIEFFNLDAAKGYKAYRMLKERLERRRHIKDEMAKTNSFLAGTSADFSSGKVDRQIKGIAHSRYTPRILNELFGLDSAGGSIAHVS